MDERRADIVAMKQHGFDAVRTSHYPDDPAFLELTDELGLFVVDEADIESHAFQAVLCEDPRYHGQWLARVLRMVLRLTFPGPRVGVDHALRCGACAHHSGCGFGHIRASGARGARARAQDVFADLLSCAHAAAPRGSPLTPRDSWGAHPLRRSPSHHGGSTS